MFVSLDFRLCDSSISSMSRVGFVTDTSVCKQYDLPWLLTSLRHPLSSLCLASASSIYLCYFSCVSPGKYFAPVTGVKHSTIEPRYHHGYHEDALQARERPDDTHCTYHRVQCQSAILLGTSCPCVYFIAGSWSTCSGPCSLPWLHMITVN